MDQSLKYQVDVRETQKWSDLSHGWPNFSQAHDAMSLTRLSNRGAKQLMLLVSVRVLWPKNLGPVVSNTIKLHLRQSLQLFHSDKTNTEAINKAISSSTKPAYTGSMVNLSENSDFEPNEHLAPIKVERSPSSVSGTSFASSDSEGNFSKSQLVLKLSF